MRFPNGFAQAEGVAIQSDGKIVAAGWRNDDDGVSDADFALVRLETDGDLDPSFSGDGKTTTTFGANDLGRAVAIQPDGKIVVAGTTRGCNVNGSSYDFALARYNVNGSLDTSFSGDGKLTTGFGGAERANGVAIQADGRIVAAGETDVGGDSDFAIARYHAISDNTPPNTTITGGPSGVINSTSATFTFVSSEPGSKFTCSLDGTSFTSCSSPKSYSNLTDGSHLFSVRAIDAAGNTDPTPAGSSVSVDTKAPKVDSVFPAEDATGVGPAVNVRATFSEDMTESSITTDTIKLFRAGTTTPRAAVVSYDTQTKTATLNPENNLRLATKYKAVVTAETKDRAGNQLDQDQDPTNGNQSKRWFFTIRN